LTLSRAVDDPSRVVATLAGLAGIALMSGRLRALLGCWPGSVPCEPIEYLAIDASISMLTGDVDEGLASQACLLRAGVACQIERATISPNEIMATNSTNQPGIKVCIGSGFVQLVPVNVLSGVTGGGSTTGGGVAVISAKAFRNSIIDLPPSRIEAAGERTSTDRATREARHARQTYHSTPAQCGSLLQTPVSPTLRNAVV
jgi:hypothetical protein